MPGEPISREAFERIIPRPAELQAAERDIGEGLTKEELLELGQDRDRRFAAANAAVIAVTAPGHLKAQGHEDDPTVQRRGSDGGDA